MIPIHPKIVHFPVALLLSATLFGLLALVIKGKEKFFQEVVIWLLGLGTGAAYIANFTGLLQENGLVQNDEIHELMELHELLGFIIAGVFLILLLWLLFRKQIMKKIELAMIVFLMVLTSVTLAYGAHLGGKMVYEEGAGVDPNEKCYFKGSTMK